MSDHEHQKHLSDSEDDSIMEEKEQKLDQSSDIESDTFEDANSVEDIEDTITSPVERTRSLTKRRSSSIKSNTQDISADIPSVPTVPLPESNGETDHEEIEPDNQPPKSPLLTSHRMSATSLHNVNLEDGDDFGSPPPPPPLSKVAPEETNPDQPPELPPKPSIVTPMQGLSGPLPDAPFSTPPPPAPPASASLPPPPAPITRKLTSPFSWLSRNTSAPKENVKSPPLPSPPTNGRRNTASSIATISSNPEMMLNRLEGDNEIDITNGAKRVGRNSLRDRFKLLRMREEAGITELPEKDEAGNAAFGGLIRQSTSLGLGVAGSHDDKDSSPISPVPPTSPNPVSVNPALAPGTASGVSAGPSAMGDPEAPVDWDLWQNVVYEGPAAVARTSAEELNHAIATGIPHAIRGVVWQVLAESKNEELEVLYRNLVNRGTDKDKDRMSTSSGVQSNGSIKETVVSSASSIHSDKSTPATTVTNGMRSPSPPSEKDVALSLAEKKKKAKEDAAALTKLERAIKRDLGARTSYSKFAASAGLQDGLFGLCKAYALYDEGVGYAQGMNFLVMPLLFNMPEEEAFCLLVRLMNQYHLRDLFIQDMPGLHKHLYQFERLLEDFEPALYCHLHRRQVTPPLLVLRIYDLILSEGLEAILKFGIVLMQKNAAHLLTLTDMAALTTFLKDRLFDVYIDASPSAGSILESGFFGNSGASIDKEVYRADHMIQDACAVKITPKMLETYALEWEEKTKLEKDREAELEHLKSTNISLTHKVRRLEERVESHDTEHAALATELVRTKVENQEIQEENETIKEQVKELKNVINRLPEEIEAKLQSEMDRLMKRNQEVHEENQRLEDEMNEMEQNLVETKMKYAEINAAHEALNRKWTDLRKALGD
ncbi:hypothetical protein EYC84_001549 [Monilinia fructicola]|uniref:GTPase-activating protein GYP5 n=1 Tax=Monilinia fructicola TaxID=38448 RepID=A0A5M9JSG1_MONFR|nr:hypothetical protein EYC84_001549 [Monilinia fructicola]